MSELTNIKNIEVAKIVKSFDYQARRSFDEVLIRNLANSMEKNGFLQNIIVVANMDDTYMLVAGETRYKAATEAGLEAIPALVYPYGTDMDMLIKISVQENSNRSALTAYEQFLLFNRLMEEKKVFLPAQLEKYFEGAFSLSQIRKVLSYGSMPKEIIDDAEKGKMQSVHVIDQMRTTFRRIVKNKKISMNKVNFKERVALSIDIWDKYILPVYRKIRDENIGKTEAILMLKKIGGKQKEIKSILWTKNEARISMKELSQEKKEELKAVLSDFFANME